MKQERQTIYNFDARLAIAPAVEGKPTTLSGYALVWGVLSTDRGGYRVRLRPGSVRFAPEVHALLNHNYERLIGTTANGTLRLMSDDVGVRVEVDLPNTSDGRDVAELVRRRDLRGMSFGIPGEPKYVETTADGMVVRDYTSFELDEISATPIPAFSATILGIKGEPANVVPPITPAPPAPAPLIGYSRRTADALTLEKFRFDSLRLHGAQIPVPVR